MANLVLFPGSAYGTLILPALRTARCDPPKEKALTYPWSRTQAAVTNPGYCMVLWCNVMRIKLGLYARSPPISSPQSIMRKTPDQCLSEHLLQCLTSNPQICHTHSKQRKPKKLSQPRGSWGHIPTDVVRNLGSLWEKNKKKRRQSRK